MNLGLVAGLALVAVMAAGIVLMLRLDRQQKAMQKRIAGFDTARALPLQASPTLVRQAEAQQRTAATRLAGLIGYAPARRDQYRFPWFVVLAGCALAARMVVLLASMLVGPAAWLLLPLATIGGCHFYYAAADAGRRALLLQHFPDALALIVRAVRVGVPVVEALRAVSREAPEPTRGEFDRLHQQIAIGMPPEIALKQMAQRNALPEYSFFAAALSLQAQTGGGLTDTLETLADIIRRRIAMKERGHALSSEARTSTLVLAALPVVTGVVLYLSSPSYIAVLFTEPAGKRLLGGAILSLACGMGIMRTIIRKSLT